MKVRLEYPAVFNDKRLSLPIKILVLANVSHESRDTTQNPICIDKENFEHVLKHFGTTVQLDWERRTPITRCIFPKNISIAFTSIKDFSAEAIIHRVPILSKLFKARIAVDHAAHEAAEATVLPIGAVIDSQSEAIQAALTRYEIDMEDPKKPENETQTSFLNAISSALDPTGEFMSNAYKSQLEMIRAEIDNIISAGLDAILHHSEIRKLQATWLGLQRIVECAWPDVQIYLLDISKSRLLTSRIDQAKVADDGGCDLEKVLIAEYQCFGGQPYTLILGDYEFDSSSNDVELLDHLGRLCFQVSTLFFSAASTRLIAWGDDDAEFYLRVKSLDSLFEGPQYLKWMELRKTAHACCIFLCLPRFLLKNPARQEVEAIGLYEYEETISSKGTDWQIWGNPAYLIVEKILEEYKHKGWCGNINGLRGPAIGKAVSHELHSGPAEVTVCGPLEANLPLSKQWEFAAQGLISAAFEKESNTFTFMFPIALARARHYGNAIEEKTGEPYEHCSRRADYQLSVIRCSQWIQIFIRDNLYGKRISIEGIKTAVNRLIMDHSSGPDEIDGRPFEKSSLNAELDENDESQINLRFTLWPKTQIIDLPAPLYGEITLVLDPKQENSTLIDVHIKHFFPLPFERGRA